MDDGGTRRASLSSCVNRISDSVDLAPNKTGIDTSAVEMEVKPDRRTAAHGREDRRSARISAAMQQQHSSQWSPAGSDSSPLHKRMDELSRYVQPFFVEALIGVAQKSWFFLTL